MTQYNRPNETVFASGAKPGELESFPDIARGWGVTFDQTDGIPPMEWFNSLFKRNDEAVRYLLQKGISEWSPTEDYTIGAHVQESEKVWKAKVSSSGKRPSQTPSDWVETALTRDALVMLIQEHLGGIGVKVRVRAASTADVSLNGLHLLDGVSLVQGDRVLVKNQIQEQSNGIYVATTSEWLRSSDADTNEKVQPGFMVHVESGATQGNSIWQLITDGPIKLGSSALGFEMVSGYTGVAAGTYRSLTVDRYGRVIAGANPGTLAAYGIAIATQTDAEAPDGAADNVKPMTALRVFQTIAKRVVQATESLLGVAKIATQGQVNAGEDDAVIVTPKKLRFGFSFNASMNGYIAFPTWLGGVLIQWGTAGNIPAGGVVSVSYPMVFPNAARCVLSVPTDDNSFNVIPMSITAVGFNLRNKNTIVSTSSNWLAVGF